MIKNPFIYGEVVRGEDFADREREMAELTRDLKQGERVFLVSPRRYGKTSLIINVLMKLREDGLYTVYLDLYKTPSFAQFLELYAQEIAKVAETKLESIIHLIKELLPGLRPKIEVTPNGKPNISVDFRVPDRDLFQLANEVIEAPQKLSIKKGKGFVIAFDEFQEIQNFNKETVEKLMRASFQHHSNVAYLFAGSKKHLVYSMISDRSRAFYKMGKLMPLSKIPRSIFVSFLEQKFSETGYTVEKGLINAVLDVTEDYPYNAQLLCHKLWDWCVDSKKVHRELLDPVLNQVLAEETPLYIALWDSLPLHQRRTLQAIASQGGGNIFSHSFIEENNLGAYASVQTSIRLLVKKGILDKENNTYVFTDVFFKEWVKRKMS